MQTTLTTTGKRVITLDEKPSDAQYVTMGDAVTVRVTGVPDGASVVVFDISGRAPLTVGWATKPEYAVKWPVPAVAGRLVLRVKVQQQGHPTVDTDYPILSVPAGTTTAPPVAKPPAVVTPPVGNLPAKEGTTTPVEGHARAEWGFVASSQDPLSVITAGIARVKPAGANVIRIWIGGFNGDVSKDDRAIIDAAVAAGFKVQAVVQTTGAFGTPDIPGWVNRNAATLRKCWIIEAGNELNINEYRPTDFGDSEHWHVPYVTHWLRPLYKALSAIGVRVACTSITSQDPAVYLAQGQKLVDAGAKDCCTDVAIHVYWPVNLLATLRPMLIAYQALVGKPLHVTEANVNSHTAHDTPSFITAVIAYLAILRTCVASFAYYRGPRHVEGRWPDDRVLFDAAGNLTPCGAAVVGAVTK